MIKIFVYIGKAAMYTLRLRDGGSGGGTLSNQETDSNITNTIDFTCVPNGSGEITVTLANNATGVNYLNALELSW